MKNLWLRKKTVVIACAVVLFGLVLSTKFLPAKNSGNYLSVLRFFAETITGGGELGEVAQDILGFQALLNKTNPYPVLAPAVKSLGLDWPAVQVSSTHPPTAFLFTAPVAVLPLRWMAPSWYLIGLIFIALTFWFYGMSWPWVALLTAASIFWSPVLYAFHQIPLLWLGFVALAYYFFCKQKFMWSGCAIALAAMTKLVPALILIPFLISEPSRVKAFIGFVGTWLLTSAVLLVMNPHAYAIYVAVNKTNSIFCAQLPTNGASLIYFCRVLGIAAGAITFCGLIATAGLYPIKRLFLERLFGPYEFMYFSFLAVALLPISWVYSMAPLLPVFLYFILRGNRWVAALSIIAMLLPCMVFPWSDAFALYAALTYIAMALVFWLHGRNLQQHVEMPMVAVKSA